jgi:hypothetical protein
MDIEQRAVGVEHKDGHGSSNSSLPGLTRQSMMRPRKWNLTMDARVKPAHDNR